MKVEVAVLGLPSLISLMVSVDVRQHWEGGGKRTTTSTTKPKQKKGGGLEGEVEGGWGGGGLRLADSFLSSK